MADDLVQIIGFPELQQALQAQAQQATEVLKRQMKASGLELETEAKKHLSDVGGVDTGQLRAETRYRPSDNGLGAEVAAPNPVAAAVEYGTAPAGQLKQHMPPPAALAGWVRRHGMPASAAFVVARKIALQGIRARPWLTVAHDKIAVKALADMKTAINKLIETF